jgi:hypothetical protein
MLSVTISYLEGKTQLRKIIFCLYDKETLKIFKSTLRNLMQRNINADFYSKSK